MSNQGTGTSPFEAIRHTNPEGGEYWRARELMVVLGYTRWGNFLPTIEDAKKACEASGQAASDHMLQVQQLIPTGKGAQRAVEDYHLSRYACYLVVMNGDASKPMVALGQTYFAVRTREAELAEEAALQGMSEAQRRIYARDQLVEHNKQLAAAAQAAGVEGRGFALFMDHGYMGLYAGERARDIARRKGLARGANIADHMGFDELAANMLRASLTEQKLSDGAATDAGEANQVHFDTGQAVRAFIISQGGAPPEQLPTPALSIQQLRKLEAEQERRRLEAERQPPLFPGDPDDAS
jgi:DNA-damage-inducible protein D